MRCANPSTMAVFPTPALPISAGLFLLWRSRMSTARASSAPRPRPGSSSPRRAWAVRSTPTRSSSALPPESNSPSNGSPMRSPRPQEPQIPVDDGIAEHEHDGRAHGEEYPERDVTLLAPKQEGDVHQAAEHRRREHGQQHALPADERAHHRHHLDVAAAHRLFLEQPAPHDADRIQQGEPRGGAEHRVLEPGHSGRERGAEPDDEPGPVVFVGYQIMAGGGGGDPPGEGSAKRRGGGKDRGAPGTHSPPSPPPPPPPRGPGCGRQQGGARTRAPAAPRA